MLLCVHSAAYGNHLSTYIRGEVGGQEKACVSNISGGTSPSQRYGIYPCFTDSFGQLVGHFTDNKTGSHGIGTDPPGT